MTLDRATLVPAPCSTSGSKCSVGPIPSGAPPTLLEPAPTGNFAAQPRRLDVQTTLFDAGSVYRPRRGGLRPGDQLISVAGRRIYSTRDLMRVMSSATGGQLPLTFVRGDSRYNRLVPAGPLGISAGRESVDPALLN